MILARCDAKSEKTPPKSNIYARKTNPEVPRDPRKEEAIKTRAIHGGMHVHFFVNTCSKC